MVEALQYVRSDISVWLANTFNSRVSLIYKLLNEFFHTWSVPRLMVSIWTNTLTVSSMLTLKIIGHVVMAHDVLHLVFTFSWSKISSLGEQRNKSKLINQALKPNIVLLQSVLLDSLGYNNCSMKSVYFYLVHPLSTMTIISLLHILP